MSNDDHGNHGGGHGHDEAAHHEIDERIRQLPSIYKIEEVVQAKEGEEKIEVGDTISIAAAFYEKIRNTLEYEEDHRLRRNAIRRVIKRRIGVDVQAHELARELLTELIWARYLPNNTLPLRCIDDVAQVFLKFNPLVSATSDSADPSGAFAFILDLLAIEVESKLVPPSREDALASFMFRIIQGKIEWKKGSLAEEERELQLYLAVYRTLLKADAPRLRSRVFNLYHPKWKEGGTEVAEHVSANLDAVIATVRAQVEHPISERLSREVRKYSVLFNVLFDVVAKDPDNFLTILSEGSAFDKTFGKAAAERIRSFESRKSRRVLRAVAFLFLTKMVLALAIELPYDLIVAHETSTIPLAINIIFPPMLLAFIGLTSRIQVKTHAKMIIKGVRSIVYNTDEMKMVFKVKKPWGSTFAVLFGLIYASTFLFVFGFIGWILNLYGFNIVSTTIFLLFLTLVTFFGLQIRQSVKEVIVDAGRSSLPGAIVDMLMLPIVRVGRWISIRTPRINIILFFMDFIIEAPFKMAIEVIEGWLAFVREKKDEIG